MFPILYTSVKILKTVVKTYCHGEVSKFYYTLDNHVYKISNIKCEAPNSKDKSSNNTKYEIQLIGNCNPILKARILIHASILKIRLGKKLTSLFSNKQSGIKI